jgi:RNA polymerase sigma-70 factor (sigma-E family)
MGEFPVKGVLVVNVEEMPVLGRDRQLDDETFTEFVVAAQPQLLRTAYFLTGSQDRARELTQEALVRAYAAWPRIREEQALAYVRRILVNLRTDDARRIRRQFSTNTFTGGPTRADTRVEDRDEVLRLLSRLPRRQRVVVVLRHCCDLSEQNVADTLGISVGAVKSASSRGLAKMRELTRATEGDPT